MSLTISEWKAICLARPTLSQIWNTWRRRRTGQTDRTECETARLTHDHTDDLLSIVVGLKDVADGSAVAPPARRRLQDETKQPLVVLVRRTLNHGGERKLREESRGGDKSSETRRRLKPPEQRNRDRLTLSRVTCVWGSMSLKRKTQTSTSKTPAQREVIPKTEKLL